MNRGVFIFWAIFVAAAVFRVGQSFFYEPPDIHDCIRENVRSEGEIVAEPEIKATGQSIVVRADDICGKSILVKIKVRQYPRFEYGERVLFEGKLLEPANFSSKGGDASGRQFDYKGYLAKDDIYHEMKSAKIESIRAPVISLPWLLFRAKRAFVRALRASLGEPHAALASGLVVGEKAALGKDLLEDFRTVGLIHIVVLSGFNITIVGDAMRRMLSFLPRIWGIAVGGAGIALFGVMVGGGATVVRSCFMAGIALSADLIRRDYSVVRALVFAGLVMLIENPMILLHDPSFQLSFLATLGLITLASPIEKHLTFLPERFGLRGIVASTLATQIFVSPFILYTMGQISIIGMIVNILVLPIVPLTMLFVFLTGVAGIIWLPMGQIFGWVSHFLLSYELFMVENFARLPFAAAHLPPFSAWWVVAFYLLLAILKLRSMTVQFRLAKKSSM